MILKHTGTCYACLKGSRESCCVIARLLIKGKSMESWPQFNLILEKNGNLGDEE